MITLSESRFQALVDQALADLPPDILQHLDNVAVTVADWPSRSERAMSWRLRGPLTDH